MNEIEIYKTQDGNTEVEVRFEQETVWLSQSQIVELFKSSKANISEHLKSIFQSRELDNASTVRKFRTVRQEGKRQVSRSIDHYNLDIIISVGYRVNTKQGVRFRQWATQRLKDYLIEGVAINQKRLAQLQQTIQFISAGGIVNSLQLGEARGLLDIINSYTRSFELLSQYDNHSLPREHLSENISYEIQYDEARSA